MFELLKGFLANLSFATDLTDLFGGFGASCARYELRSFRARLLFSTIIPVVLNFGIVAAFVLRAFFFAPEPRASVATHALDICTAASLRGTSVNVNYCYSKRSFVTASTGTHGEQYLIADCAGKSQQVKIRRHFTWSRQVIVTPLLSLIAWCTVNTESTEYTSFLVPVATFPLHYCLSRGRHCAVWRAAVE